MCASFLFFFSFSALSGFYPHSCVEHRRIIVIRRATNLDWCVFGFGTRILDVSLGNSRKQVGICVYESFREMSGEEKCRALASRNTKFKALSLSAASNTYDTFSRLPMQTNGAAAICKIFTQSSREQFPKCAITRPQVARGS